nr:hypothetical protein [Phaeobacter inhibens]
MANYKGWMHAEGYSGFNDLYRSGAVSEVACLLGSMLRMRLLRNTWLIYGASSLTCSNRKGPAARGARPAAPIPSKSLPDDLAIWTTAQVAQIADDKITRLIELMPWRYAADAA